MTSQSAFTPVDIWVVTGEVRYFTFCIQVYGMGFVVLLCVSPTEVTLLHALMMILMMMMMTDDDDDDGGNDNDGHDHNYDNNDNGDEGREEGRKYFI